MPRYTAKPRGRASARRNNEEQRMARRVDKLRQHEEFEEQILPELRKMLKAGKSAGEIYEFAQNFAAARAVTIALTDADSNRALGAVKEILDRSQGKAKERTEVEHKFAKLRDEELDALLESRLQETTTDEDDATTEQH